MLKILGMLLIMEAGFMLLSLLVAQLFPSTDSLPLLVSTLITLISGISLRIITRKLKIKNIDRKLGFLIVSMIWLVMSLYGALPYFLGGYLPTFFDAFFESLSGFTTTSATVVSDVEALPNGILFWRSLTNWIGGVGIVVIFISFIPFIGGGMSLFAAEVTGPQKEKFSPHIRTTAKIIVGIYCGLTVMAALSLWIAGMEAFDSVCHALTTLSSGGFSTQNNSISLYSPTIQYIIILFLIPSGINFPILYYALKGRFKRIWINEEFRVYIYVILLSTAFLLLLTYNPSLGLEESLRHSLFQTVSLITSAGFISFDYGEWGSSASLLLVILMFSGAMSGSTTGGLKLARVILLFKNARNIIRKSLHPRAIIPLRFENKIVEPRVLNNVLLVFLLYILSFSVASLALIGLGLGVEESAGASLSCLSNMGIGFGEIGSFGNYSFLSYPIKSILLVLMYLGRLELVTVLVLFMPSLWKKGSF